ncbi:MAG: hypothetical protein HFE62_01670 [Firmicutes bacterium]|nr:hypothetical protein [Bacillota bacterium]
MRKDDEFIMEIRNFLRERTATLVGNIRRDNAKCRMICAERIKFLEKFSETGYDFDELENEYVIILTEELYKMAIKDVFTILDFLEEL